jgi:hypothetical protein
MTEQVHLVLTPVRADRTAEFERFVAAIRPALLAQRPELDSSWQLMRATGTQDGIVTYVFLLQGGSLTDDWELGVILPAHYGEEEAERVFEPWAQALAPLRQWADAAVAAGEESNQAVWTLEPVDLA